jgi:hypothetical protein
MVRRPDSSEDDEFERAARLGDKDILEVQDFAQGLSSQRPSRRCESGWSFLRHFDQSRRRRDPCRLAEPFTKASDLVSATISQHRAKGPSIRPWSKKAAIRPDREVGDFEASV